MAIFFRKVTRVILQGLSITPPTPPTTPPSLREDPVAQQPDQTITQTGGTPSAGTKSGRTHGRNFERDRI